jgi:predicted RNA-binding protein with EMAP domain
LIGRTGLFRWDGVVTSGARGWIEEHMTVLAMSVERVEDHPDADSLRVHQLRAGERTAQVVANLETVYAVGDVVAVALTGSTTSRSVGSGFGAWTRSG